MDIQARLYWRNLEYNIRKDPYFKDFTVADYRFIVVNKTTLTPLVWLYENTKVYGTIYYGKNNNIVCRDPFMLAEELNGYINNNSIVQNGINLDKDNSLKYWLETYE